MFINESESPELQTATHRHLSRGVCFRDATLIFPTRSTKSISLFGKEDILIQHSSYRYTWTEIRAPRESVALSTSYLFLLYCILYSNCCMRQFNAEFSVFVCPQSQIQKEIQTVRALRGALQGVNITLAAVDKVQQIFQFFIIFFRSPQFFGPLRSSLRSSLFTFRAKTEWLFFILLG
jgi:hypothetical protein